MMTSRERVLTALKGKEADRVPFCEQSIAQNVVMSIAGRDKELTQKEISKLLKRDNVAFDLTPPIFARKEISDDGQSYYTEGLIKTRDDLKLMKFPDPKDKELIVRAKEFVKGKEDYAAAASVRLGAAGMLNSMGVDNFCMALADDPSLVSEILEKYAEWTMSLMEWVNEIGFDLVWSFDDIAFRTAPLFSPEVFREIFLPVLRKASSTIKLPWIYHSDGNLMPILDDLLTLGMSGLHPVEPEAMDIEKLKLDYGRRICLLGNINVHHLATRSPEEIDEEVKERISCIALGGGYIVSSSNSIPSYAKPENFLAMAKAIQKYGKYPIHL